MGTLNIKAWAGALALAAGGVDRACAQLVFAYPTFTYDLRRFDATLNDFVAPRPVSLEVFGMAADDQGLYIACATKLYRWLYNASAPTLVGTFSGAVTSITGGLAWDSTRGVLYGTGGSSGVETFRLVQIDPITCATTLVQTFPLARMHGLDYDPVGDRLIFTQNRAAALNGYGLYALPWPYATATPSRLAPYQFPEEIDVDGVAVGGGYAWLVCDEAQWLYRFNLSTNTYEPPILMSFNLHNNISVGATWAPGMMDPVEHDLGVMLVGPSDCGVLEGATATLIAHAQRIGGTQTTSGVVVTFNLPASVDLDSVRSVPLGARDAQGRWSVPLGSLGPNATRTITLTIDDVPATPVVVNAQINATQVDPRPQSNSATATVRAREQAGSQANGIGLGVQVMASTVTSDPSSQFGGVVGGVDAPQHQGLAIGLDSARLVSLGIDGRGARGIAHSPNGAWVLAHAMLDTGGMVLLRIRTDASVPARVVARTGVGPMVTLAAGTFAPTRLDSAAINDLGTVGLAVQVDQRAALIRIDENGVASTVLEQGVTELLGIGPGATPSAVIQSPAVGELGQLACVVSVAGVPTSVDRAIVADDGARVVAQRGITLPTGQVDAGGGATLHLVRALDEGLPGLGLSMDPLLQRWIAPGAIAASQSIPANSGLDRVALQGAGFGDASVVAQENVPLSLDAEGGPLADVEPLAFCEMDATGSWWVGVRRRDGGGALVRDGFVVAQSGDPAWIDGPLWASDAQTVESGQGAGQHAFVGLARATAMSGADSTVIAGHVESASPRRSGVVVLEGVGPVLRENEAVLGDGAGSLHIGELIPGGASVSATDALMLVGLRSRGAAEGCAVDTPAGLALVRVPLASACPNCAADYDDNGGVDGGDLAAFFADFEVGATCADVDQNGGVDGGDLGAFFLAFEAGGCS